MQEIEEDVYIEWVVGFDHFLANFNESEMHFIKRYTYHVVFLNRNR